MSTELHPSRATAPLALVLSISLLAASAAADTFLGVDLRSDRAPGTEVVFAETRAWSWETGWEADDGRSIFTTDDLLGGIRIAEFPTAPENTELMIQVKMLNVFGDTVQIYSTNLYHDSIPKVIGLSTSRFGGRVGGERSYWSFPTTDGALPVACADGYAADGIRCRGSHCAEVSLHCKTIPGAQGMRRFLAPISEEAPGSFAGCDRGANEMVTSIGCTGDDCDDVTLGCTPHEGFPQTACARPFLSPPISEEQGSFRLADSSACYMRTMSCSGSFCDDKSMSFDQSQGGPIRAYEGFDDPGLCMTLTLGQPWANDCSDPDFGPILEGHVMHWRLEQDGALHHGLGDACIVVSQIEAGAPAGFGTCGEAARQWEIDRWGLIRVIGQIDLCLGIDNGGFPGEEGPLVLQDCGLAPRWALTQAEPARMADDPALILSEYVEGSGVDDAIEITNLSDGPVDLSAYALQIHRGTDADPLSPSETIALAGLLPAGDSFVVARDDPGLDPMLTALAGQLADGLVFEGADTILLQWLPGAMVVDSIGQLGAALPVFADASVTARDRTLRRQEDICEGDTDPMDPFIPSEEWTEHPLDTFDGLGTHDVTCVPEPGLAVGLCLGTLSLAGARRTAGRARARRARPTTRATREPPEGNLQPPRIVG